MKKIKYLLIILTTTTSFSIKPEWFTGCQNFNTIKSKTNDGIVKVDFTKACSNLISCANNIKKNRLNCENEFYVEMNNFCYGYDIFITNPNWRKISCLEISKRNFELVKNLDSWLFKYNLKNDLKNSNKNNLNFLNFFSIKKKKIFKKKFFGVMAIQNSYKNKGDECFDFGNFLVSPCDINKKTQIFTFIDLGNNKMFIKTQNNLCLSQNEEWDVICNNGFDQEFRIVKLEEGVYRVKGDGKIVDSFFVFKV